MKLDITPLMEKHPELVSILESHREHNPFTGLDYTLNNIHAQYTQWLKAPESDLPYPNLDEAPYSQELYEALEDFLITNTIAYFKP